MPKDNDFVSKSLAAAKNALAGARSFSASAGDTGAFAPKPVSAPASMPKPKPASGILKEASDAGQGIKSRMEQTKTLGSMKKGGKVPKTGLYKMHKGEDVVKADKTNIQDVLDRAKDSLAGAAAKAKLHMRIEPTDDGRFVVNHEHRGGMEPMKSPSVHAPSNLKELLKHIESHYSPASEPDADEKAGAEEQV